MTDAAATSAFLARTVRLPGGRTLTVRPIEPGDADGLGALYEGLTPDDRYRRFFSSYHPDRTFLERATTVAERGGFGLVAVAQGPDGTELAGEASWFPLPDGDGELAITVGAGWRGWLGPYLVDALLEAAAASGLANLQAEVLSTNRSMLGVLRARGCATMDHPDWTEVRVVVGTTGRTPRWPGTHDRPRVLVEAPGGRWHAEADAIVVSHPAADPRWRDVAGAHAGLHGDVPLCIEPSEGGGRPPRAATVLRGDAAAVVAVVAERDLVRALAGRQDPATTRVIEVATRDIVWCDVDATVADVAAEMMDRYVRHVLVEDDGELAGVTSARDLLGVYATTDD